MTRHPGPAGGSGRSIADARLERSVLRDQVHEFRAAISMLTRIRGGSTSGELTGARMFALVGALTGIAGSVPLLGFGAAVLPVGAILAVGAMAIVSGALHLDGLADTGDALVAAGPDAAERARTDPSIGVGGAVALILVTGLEIACLSLLAGGPGPLVAGLACVVGASGSRVAPVVLAIAARPSATAGGLGAWFSDRVTVGDALFAGSSAALLAVVAAVWSGSPGLLVGALVGLGIGTVLGLALVHARGQLDGDGYGATVELTFAVTLVSIALLVRTAGA